MSTLVGDDPETSTEQASHEAVQCPEGHVSGRAREWVRQESGGNELLQEISRFVGARNSNDIPEAMDIV